MTITINGSGTIAGITAGGLPDAVIQTADIVDLAVTPAKMSQKLTSGTSVASTSGTSIDFTSIPSWVKRITVMFNGVSLSGTSNFLFQLGAGSIDATSYVGQANAMPGGGSTAGVTPTTGFGVYSANAGNIFSGSATITLIGSNTWVCVGTFAAPANFVISVSGGTKTLSGTLDRLRITTVNGTDTFDAGSINIMYEG